MLKEMEERIDCVSRVIICRKPPKNVPYKRTLARLTKVRR
jgi:hypothetical protein